MRGSCSRQKKREWRHFPEIIPAGFSSASIFPIRFRPPDPTVPVSWNDRAVMTFSAAHGSGIGEMEFMAAIDETESKEVEA